MNGKQRKITLVVIITLTLSMAAAAQASSHCSLASSAGKWAFTINGNIPAIGPTAAIGEFTQDAHGNIVGTETGSLNGEVADDQLIGTAKVNPDCSGTDTIQVFENGALVRTSMLEVIYDDNEGHARAVFTSIVLPDGTQLPSILTVDARKLFPQN